MPRCPWSGDKCDCGGLDWRLDEHGFMPQRCEDRLPFWVGTYRIKLQQVRPAYSERYERWAKEIKEADAADEEAGRPN